jgi:serine/threonine-protein kinase
MDTKATDPLRGALIGGRYRVMGRLARGGMASVYQARDERLERAVAIKILEKDHAHDAQFVRRLAEEARTVARLSHPNVVAVFDQGIHDDSPYLVMEYVRGRTLRAVLSDRGRLDPSESLAILEQILAALAMAHRSGLVHRDIKPENVLITPPPNGSGDLVDAVVKVADFGLANRAEADEPGSVMATPEYVAPELVADGRGDARSDLYSTGVVLFEMLTGRPPFSGERPADVAWQHVDREVPVPSQYAPGLPPFVDQIVSRATSRDPAGRPRDAAAMLAQVQSVREDVGALAGPTRALAHPTVLVGQVPAVERPSWARLPGARQPSADQQPRRGVGELAGVWHLRAALGRARDWLEEMRRTQRGRRQLVAALVVVGVLLAGGGWWLGFGRYVEAPALTALTDDSARAEATRLGFHVAYAPEIYDENIPKGTVMRQRPDAGGRIVRGGTITLTLSAGPERFLIPNVVGQSVDFAHSEMDGHVIVRLVDGYSDNLPANFVVSTTPAAGEPVKPGTEVTVVVAKGRFPVHVPDVVGTALNDAQKTLKNAGFTQVQVQRQDDPTQPRDQVLSQDPAGDTGEEKASGVTITLVVSNGPPGTPMPSVVNQPCDSATNGLQAAGYQVHVQGFSGFGATVKAQDPAAGEPIQPGGTINLQCGF